MSELAVAAASEPLAAVVHPVDTDAGLSEIPRLFKIVTTIVFIFLFAPIVVIVMAGLNWASYLTFPPQGLSLKWVQGFLQSSTFLPAYLLSLELALLAAFFASVIGIVVAMALSRLRFPGRQVIRATFLSPLMLPGMVLGLALYLYYLSFPIGLSHTFMGLVIGHTLIVTPVALGTTAAALFSFDISLEQAARSLGAGPFRAFFSITMRIVWPSIMAGFFLAVIISFGQFDVSLFLATPNLTPLPIAIYQSLQFNPDPTSAAAGIFAILLVLVTMFITTRLTSIQRLGGLRFH